jgi:hypothetical protein
MVEELKEWITMRRNGDVTISLREKRYVFCKKQIHSAKAEFRVGPCKEVTVMVPKPGFAPDSFLITAISAEFTGFPTYCRQLGVWY